MLTRAVVLFLVSSLTLGTDRAATDPFVGTWLFNPGKSRLIDQMTIGEAGVNKYLLNFGGGAETVVADGTDQPGLAGSTVSLAIEWPRKWRIVRKMNRRTLVTGEWTLSEDGRTLKDHFTQYAADGAPSSIDYLYTRTAGSSDFTGAWETRLEQGSFELHVTSWEENGLSLVNSLDPSRAQHVKFDGADYPTTGPNVTAGSTSSGRRLDARRLEITEKIKGTVSATRRLTLSSDEKTLTMTISPVGRTKPNVLVFDRKGQ